MTRVYLFFVLTLLSQSNAAWAVSEPASPCWTMHKTGVHEWQCAKHDLPAQGQDFALSLIVLNGASGVIVLDSGATAAVGASAFKAITERFPGKTIWILNSQPKPEHVLGNVGFVGVPAKRIVAGQLTVDLMKARCPKCIDNLATRMGEASVAGTQAVIPAHTLKTPNGSLRFVGEEFSAWRYTLEKSVETEEAVVLHNKVQKLHWVGSLVQNRDVPDLFDGDVVRRIAYLASLGNRLGQDETLLGSFGVLDHAWVQRNLNYFVQLQLDVLLGLDVGVNEVELIQQLSVGLNGQALQLHQLNIQRVARQSEAYLFDENTVVE